MFRDVGAENFRLLQEHMGVRRDIRVSSWLGFPHLQNASICADPCHYSSPYGLHQQEQRDDKNQAESVL